jgi:hypothetical protein
MIDIHAHVEALVSALEARGVRVYESGAGQKIDGTFETPVEPYAVLYSDGGIRSGESVADEQDEHAELDVDAYSVGTSPRSARAVQSDLLALVGEELTVAGRLVHIRSVFSDAVKPDRDDPRKALWQGRDGLTVVSLKA